MDATDPNDTARWAKLDGELVAAREAAEASASLCAPFIHPRASTATFKAPEAMTDQELDELLAMLPADDVTDILLEGLSLEDRAEVLRSVRNGSSRPTAPSIATELTDFAADSDRFDLAFERKERTLARRH